MYFLQEVNDVFQIAKSSDFSFCPISSKRTFTKYDSYMIVIRKHILKPVSYVALDYMKTNLINNMPISFLEFKFNPQERRNLKYSNSPYRFRTPFPLFV